MTVPVAAPVVYAYLADLGHVTQWDPATTEVVRLSGDGDVGTTYRLRTTAVGDETDLAVETVEAVRTGESGPVGTLVFRGTDGKRWLTRRLTLTATDDGATDVVLRTDYVFDLWRNLIASTVAKPRAERQAGLTAVRLHDVLCALED